MRGKDVELKIYEPITALRARVRKADGPPVEPIATFAKVNTISEVEVVQDLRGTLIGIGKFKSLELQYAKVHMKPVKKLWEDFDFKRRANKRG